MSVVIYAISAVGALACGNDPESRQTADWTVRDSAGVTQVENHTDLTSRGCVTVIPDPLTTIHSGAELGDPSPPLYRVRGAAVLEDGRIVVLNEGSDELFFFTADGMYQHAVGGSGRGPGEFNKPTWLGQGDGDTLFVWDSGLARLTKFNGAGELITSHQVRADDWEDMPGAIEGRFDDGSFFVRPASLVFFGGETGVVRGPESYGRYDVETLKVERFVIGSGRESVVGEGPIYELPFGKTDVAIAHGDAIVIGDNGTSTLRHYDMTGGLRRVVKWVSNPIPVTDRDRKAYRRYVAKAFPPQFARLYVDARFASERPRFSSIQRDPTGWIWVQSFAASWEPQGPWLLFDDDGVLRCRADLPARLRVLQIGRSHILGVQSDELGEETVVRFGLVRSLR